MAVRQEIGHAEGGQGRDQLIGPDRSGGDPATSSRSRAAPSGASARQDETYNRSVAWATSPIWTHAVDVVCVLSG